MTKARFSFRDLEITISNGGTIEDLKKRFGCSEEGLRKRVLRLFQGNEKKVNRIFSELEKNEKKRIRKNIKEKNMEKEIIEPTKTLEELRTDEEALSKELAELEKEYRGHHHDRFMAAQELETHTRNLKEYRKILVNIEEEMRKAVEKANASGEKANAVLALMQGKRVALEEVRAKIEQMSKIAIYVYDDGSIVTDNDHTLNDEGFLELRENLIHNKECEELRVRDITTLARLLQIHENLKGLGGEQEFDIENPELERVFQILAN